MELSPLKRKFKELSEVFANYEEKNKGATAIIYVLTSSIFFVLVSICVKMLHGFSPSQILYIRSTISFVMSTAYMQQGDIPSSVPDKGSHTLLMVRCIIGSAGNYYYFKALHSLEISDAMTIFLTSPLWTAILAGIILREKLSIGLFGSIGCGFLGILLLVQPNFLKELLGIASSFDKEENRMLGFMYGLLYAILSSFTIVVIRKLCGKVHNSVVIHYSLYASFMISSIDLICLGEFNSEIFTFQNLIWAIFLSFFNYSCQLLFSRALFLEKVTKLAPFTYLSVLFGFIVEVTFFNKSLNLVSILGSSLVIIGNFTTVIMK